MSSFLSRNAIFAVPDIQSEDVFVPQWSGTVRVKGLTARERDQFEADILRGKGKNVEVVKQNLRAKLVVRAAVDEAGNRLFGDGDIAFLGEKSAAAIDLLYGVASRLSGISGDDEEELAKNSVSDQSADSPSA